MNISLRWVAAGLGAVLSAAVASASVLFPHESSDLQPDPAYTFGRLPNGLRYAVRSNPEPASRVFLILRVHAGSIHERDDQQGFAHFVEHMAFNGTRKFPGTTLVDTMQRSGYSLGAHISAFTSYNSTFYQLDAPRNDPATLRQAFTVLREFSEGVLFDPRKIKKESGVVESEQRAYTTSAKDIGRELDRFLYGGTRIVIRPVLGSPEQLRGATTEQLREFYTAWYRPSRMTLIAVGDLSVEKLTALITEHFSELADPDRPPPPEPPMGSIQQAERVEARYIATHLPGGTSAVLYSIRPDASPSDNVAARRKAIALAAGFWILHERLQRVVRANPVEYGQAQATWTDFLNVADVGLLRVDTKSGMWRGGVVTLEQELRRALTHGFTTSEVDEQKRRLETNYKEAIHTTQKVSSAALARSLLWSLDQNFVPTAPDETWAVVKDAVEILTPEACLAAFRAAWPGNARKLVILGTDEAPGADKEIVEVFLSSSRMSLADEETVNTEVFAYNYAAEPGTIVRRTHHADVDVHQVEFANGVRLTVKRTDFEANRIYTRARVGYGRLVEPLEKTGISVAAATTLLAGGLGRHDETSLNRILASESLGLSFQVDEDAYSFWGWSGRASFRRLVELHAAHVQDPAFREPPMFTAMMQLRGYYDALVSSPEQLTNALVPRLLHGGDHRHGVPNADMVFRHSASDLRNWIEPVLTKGPLDLSVIGDVDVEEAIAEVARTLGSLPPRETRQPPAEQLRPASLIRQTEETINLTSKLRKASVMVAWPFQVERPVEDPRRLRMLSNLIHLRVVRRVREELGATYAPVADFWQSAVWPTQGYLVASVVVEPDKARKIAATLREVCEDLARNGMTEDEFQQVYQPKIATLDEELRNNAYWLHYVLPYLTTHPWIVRLPTTRTADYRSMTREELNMFARRYLRPAQTATLIATSP